MAVSLPEPYYSEDGITIYHGDCREILPGLTADALITDPPYGVGLVTKTSDYRQSDAFDNGASLRASVLYEDSPEYVSQLIRKAIPPALKVCDRALIFCGTRMMFAYPEPTAIGCVFTPSGAGHSTWGFQVMHPILFYGADPYLADGKGGRPNGFRTEQPNLEKVDHPCPKPLPWMTWAVNRASRLGETILDPFMGSGTTLLAARLDGRRAIGIEIEERYCEIAVERLAQGVLPLSSPSRELDRK
jgi:site-specific DNA-methyltransferase (adenine-specific)